MENTGGLRQKGASLSYEQERLWSLHRQMPEVPLCNVSTAVRLCGALDVDALRDSMEAFVDRHHIWRTVFPTVGGRPTQVVRPPGRWACSIMDLCELAEPEREGEALRRAAEDARQPFDLARGPLVRALLVRVGDHEHRLYLTLHRIIFDRASLTQVFLPELRELYEAKVQGRQAELEEPLQYEDYATWQLGAQGDGNALAAQREYWREYLAGAPTVLELPRDHGGPGHRSYRGASLEFAISEELITRLRELGRQEQATLRMTLTAAFAALLYRYTGQEDLLLGLALSGHEWGPWQRTVGCFVNPVVLRMDMAEEPNVVELLKRTRVACEATRNTPISPLLLWCKRSSRS